MVKANWDMSQASIPHFFMKTNDGITNLGQWSILSPTIYTITHFFTANGVIPEEDETFTSEDKWYEVADGIAAACAHGRPSRTACGTIIPPGGPPVYRPAERNGRRAAFFGPARLFCRGRMVCFLL